MSRATHPMAWMMAAAPPMYSGVALRCAARCWESVTGSPVRCYAMRAGPVNGLEAAGETARPHSPVRLGHGAESVRDGSHPLDNGRHGGLTWSRPRHPSRVAA